MTQPNRIVPSIKKFTMKKVVHFKGRDGQPLTQAELFFKNKRVAFYTEDEHCIDSAIRWDYKSQALVAEAKQVIADYMEENKDSEDVQLLKEDALVVRLLELKDYLPMYRKSLQKGLDGIVVAEYSDFQVLILQGRISSVETLRKKAEQEAAKSNQTVTSFETFFSPEDFVIG